MLASSAGGNTRTGKRAGKIRQQGLTTTSGCHSVQKPKSHIVILFPFFFSVLVVFQLPKTHHADRAVAWLVSVFLPVLGKARVLLSSAAFPALRSYEALAEVLGSGATGLAHP